MINKILEHNNSIPDVMKEIGKTKKIIFILSIIALIYFIFFIFTNINGSADPAMLCVKNLDEYSQYSHLKNMFTVKESFGATMKNFLYYNYYYYGFIFFFISWVVLAPGIILFHADILWLNLLLLRQLGVVLSISSAFLLVYLWTDFKKYWSSIGIFLFLLTLPAVVENNLWWHPDSLALFFIILTIFCLVKDRYRYHTYFYLSAVFCGLATGTKLLGIFFFLTIFTYLLCGLLKKKISFKKTLRFGCLFIMIMGLAIIISNPLLINRQEFNTYYSTQTSQSEHIKNGWVNKTNLHLNDWLNLTNSCFVWPIIVPLILSGLIWGILQNKDKQLRLLSIITLTWIIPYAVYLFCFVNMLTWRYLFPIIIPLLAGIGSFCKMSSLINKKSKIIFLLFILIFFAQIIIIRNSFYIYRNAYKWEEGNLGIIFYEQIKDKIIAPENQKLVIYRDLNIYFPETKNVEIVIKYNSINYSEIELINPDYILLEKEKMNLYLKQDVSTFTDLQGSLESRNFYQNLIHNQVLNYHIIYENDYAIALKKE